MLCQNCQAEIPDGAGFCPQCGERTGTGNLSIKERQAILERTIGDYVRRGYRVVSSTETTAQLLKQKQFSCLWASLWFLLFGIGLLFYVFYHAAKKDTIIYIAVDEWGRAKVTRGRG